MGILDVINQLVPQVASQYGYNVPGGTFTPEKIKSLVMQESAGKNEPPNKYGYTGYFQMKPSEFGLTPKDFANMSFEDQLKLYAGKYLPKYKYTGIEDLGVLNAAPAYANKPDDFVAYKAGSKEAAANPQWVKYSNADGAVTVGGIKAWAAARTLPPGMDANGAQLAALPPSALPGPTPLAPQKPLPPQPGTVAQPMGALNSLSMGQAQPVNLPAYQFSPPQQAELPVIDPRAFSKIPLPPGFRGFRIG